MRGTFVIISVSDRLQELNDLLQMLAADSRWASLDISILFQDPAGVADRIVLPCPTKTKLFVEPEKLGCHGARVLLLRKIRYDFYINLDDDMEIGRYANYWPAVTKALEPETGFVMTNWARTPALLEKKVPMLQAVLDAAAVDADEAFDKQIMLYNGGGMVYAEKIAALMRDLEPVKTAFDCAWPITSYVNGYTNYRYLGSLAVHRVCGTGGMQTFMSDTPLHVMSEQWLRFKPLKHRDGSCNDVSIPLDADVKPEAKAEHKRMRMVRFGK